jgi:hypothetical protein
MLSNDFSMGLVVAGSSGDIDRMFDVPDADKVWLALGRHDSGMQYGKGGYLAITWENLMFYIEGNLICSL